MLPVIERILYCTQLGPNTGYVFRYAYAMAEKWEAALYVLNVVETLRPEQRAVVDGYAGAGVIEHIVEEQEGEQLDRIPRRIGAFCEKEMGKTDWRQIVKRILVAEGRAHSQILAHITSLDVDLVVMGAHADSSLLYQVLGSTATKVIRRSPVPVMLCQVPEGRQDLSLDI